MRPWLNLRMLRSTIWISRLEVCVAIFVTWASIYGSKQCWRRHPCWDDWCLQWQSSRSTSIFLRAITPLPLPRPLPITPEDPGGDIQTVVESSKYGRSPPPWV